jgi:hypothetical protein
MRSSHSESDLSDDGQIVSHGVVNTCGRHAVGEEW